jgi:cytochrome b561
MSVQTARRYDRVAMSLHWIIAVLMIFMAFFGENLMRSGDTSLLLPTIHVSTGLAILVLSLGRLAWRLLNPPPALPDGTAAWEAALARLMHILFYVLMIGVPLSGMLGYAADVARHPAVAGLTYFGLVPVPEIATSFPALLVHNLGSKLVQLLVVLHVLAALKHQFLNRDGLIRRMLPV